MQGSHHLVKVEKTKMRDYREDSKRRKTFSKDKRREKSQEKRSRAVYEDNGE